MTPRPRSLLVVLALLAAVGLAGCGGDGSSDPKPTSTGTAPAASARASTQATTDGEAPSMDPGTPSSLADTPSPSEEGTGPAQAGGDFCDEYAEFFRAWAADEFGPVDLTERFRSLADIAPADLKEALTYMTEANEILVETGNLDDVPGGQEAYDAAGAELGRYATDECGLEL